MKIRLSRTLLPQLLLNYWRLLALKLHNFKMHPCISTRSCVHPSVGWSIRRDILKIHLTAMTTPTSIRLKRNKKKWIPLKMHRWPAGFVSALQDRNKKGKGGSGGRNYGGGHRRTGSKICGGSPFNSKSDGNSSPTEIPSIRGLQRALESLKEPQTASEKPQKPLREP